VNDLAKAFSLVVLAAAPLFAQPTKITVNIETKASSREQLEYARSLMQRLPMIREAHDIHVAVANAAGNLTVIERVWPDDKAAIAEANVLLAQLYLDGQMPRNAVQEAERALASAPNEHRLHAVAARAHDRLGHKTEAAASFEKVLKTFDPRRGTPLQNVRVLSAAAFFFEKEKEYEKSAAALRRAAALEGLRPANRLTLLLQSAERSARTSNRQTARRDLDHLREAYRAAMQRSTKFEEREFLKIVEESIRELEKKLQ
jgi:Tfp pilus assembly protein PilF